MTFLIEGGQNLNFAVSINYLRGMLQSAPSAAASRLAPLHDQGPTSTNGSGGIFVYFYRTANHIQNSSEPVFQAVTDNIMLFLKTENVPMVNDRVGRIFASSGQSYPAYELITTGEKAGGAGLLYVTVDRPFSAWLKVIAKFYDSNGRVLWQEEAEKKSGLTSRGSIEKVCQTLESKIRPHLSTLVESPTDDNGRRPSTSVANNPR
jgi:hypothetical protein